MEADADKGLGVGDVGLGWCMCMDLEANNLGVRLEECGEVKASCFELLQEVQTMTSVAVVRGEDDVWFSSRGKGE